MAFDYQDSSFATPLIKAILKNNVEEVREALNQGFNANLPDNRGWTPIHEAAISDSRIECLKELLAHNTSYINAQTFLGETPLFLACQSECVKTVNLLLKQPKCDINLCNSEGVSPLHISCNKGSLQIVNSLVESGAKINMQDFNSYTVLHETVTSVSKNLEFRDEISSDICQYLLKHGADPDIMEFEGNYPFHFACQNGLLKCANVLLSASKQHYLINLKNNDGRTPIMMAVPSLNLALVEMLLIHGANINIADEFSITALHLAAHSGNFNMFSAILRATSKETILKYCTFDEMKDTDQIVRGKRLNSIICLAIDTENLTFLTKVLESDLDPAVLQCPVIHAENSYKKTFTLHTPISFLLESKMYDLGDKTLNFLETLIKHKSPLKVTSNNELISYISPVCAGLVALNDCSVELVMKCLTLLLQQGADPDEPYGRMPFAMEQAIMRECSGAVLLLLQFSNILEPECVLRWIEQETSANQTRIIEMLLPLAPYYTPSEKLLPNFIDSPKRKNLLTPKVHSLMVYCRTVIRKQLHEETKSNPSMFILQLSNLDLPKKLCSFLRFM